LLEVSRWDFNGDLFELLLGLGFYEWMNLIWSKVFWEFLRLDLACITLSNIFNLFFGLKLLLDELIWSKSWSVPEKESSLWDFTFF